MRAMRRTLLTGLLLAGVVLGACGNDDEKAQTTCLSEDPGVEAAARDHAKVIVVGAKAVEGQADRVDVATCRTSDENATATVTVLGIRDDSVRDQRHQLTLERKNARWLVVRDLDTQRCRKGRGHQDFSSVKCV
jgi:ribonucleotide monophosphatase NagD (HAD superfamily)